MRIHLRTTCHRLALLLPLLAVSCNATVLHLLSSGDPVRSSETAAEGFQAPGFSDAAWTKGATPVVTGAAGQVLLRQRFDVGADAAAFTELSLDVAASHRAWINGQPLGDGAARSGATTYRIAPGLLLPSGNLLAIEATAPPGSPIAPQLDGRPDGGAPHFTLGPWLQAPAPDGITVVFETSSPMPGAVVVDGQRFDGGGGSHHVARVTGLLPSRAYRYHVEAGALVGEEGTFTTAPNPGEPVTFVVWGDHRTEGDTHRRGAAAVLAESPDFIVDTGDLVNTSTDQEWRDFFAAEYSLLRQVPVAPALGNHETQSGGVERFQELFPVSGGQRSYGIDVGSVHVAVLDSNSSLETQAVWLDRDLAEAQARGASSLFIALHHGLASSGNSIGHGSNDAVGKYIAPVARAHGVLAIFAGHDHFYERGAIDGLYYVVSGGGGAPIHRGVDRLSTTSALKLENHHVVVRVSGRSVELRAISPEGQVLDEATLR